MELYKKLSEICKTKINWQEKYNNSSAFNTVGDSQRAISEAILLLQGK